MGKNDLIGRDYWKNRLDPTKRNLYNGILRSLTDGSGVTENVPFTKDVNYYNSVVSAVFLDHPEIFAFCRQCSLQGRRQGLFGDSSFTLSLKRVYKSYEENRLVSALSASVKKILDDLSTKRGEREKSDCILSHIAACASYQIDSFFNESPVSVFVRGKAQCIGFARAYKYVCDMVGIDCICLIGDLKSQLNDNEFHAWNIVAIDGRFYHIDPTSATTGIQKNPGADFARFYRSDTSFSENYVWDRSSVPACPCDMPLASPDDNTPPPRFRQASDARSEKVSCARSDLPHIKSLYELRNFVQKQYDAQISRSDFVCEITAIDRQKLLKLIENDVIPNIRFAYPASVQMSFKGDLFTLLISRQS